MNDDRFDWTLKKMDEATGELVWAVLCRTCGQTAAMPGIERLSGPDQDATLKRAALVHEGQCPGRASTRA